MVHLEEVIQLLPKLELVSNEIAESMMELYHMWVYYDKVGVLKRTFLVPASAISSCPSSDRSQSRIGSAHSFERKAQKATGQDPDFEYKLTK
eukprot:1184160-Prorocentrum_minimum.AAC.4